MLYVLCNHSALQYVVIFFSMLIATLESIQKVYSGRSPGMKYFMILFHVCLSLQAFRNLRIAMKALAYSYLYLNSKVGPFNTDL